MTTDAATEPWDATTLMEPPRADSFHEPADVRGDTGPPSPAASTTARDTSRDARHDTGRAAGRGAPLVLAAGRASRHYWRDLSRYRELLFFLAWRDLSVRYKQTVIGIAWAVLRPALTMLVFVGFRRMAGLPASSVPEPILVLAAVLPWQFFATALTDASGSLVGNTSLIGKVYFPRLLIPLAAIGTSFADFAVTLAMLAIVMAWYGFAPTAAVVALPVFVLMAMMLELGLGLLLAALSVAYRDFRYIVPFGIQFSLFVSPVAFTSANVPEAWRPLYALNPLVGIIDGFRWSLLGPGFAPDAVDVGLSVAMTALLLALGLWYFRRTERTFADVI